PAVFLLAVATMSAGLLVLGAYLLLVANLRSVLARAGEDLRLVAFTELRGPASDERVGALAEQIPALRGVGPGTYVARAEALARLHDDLGADAGVLDWLQRNPLPGSFEIAPPTGARDPAELRALASRLEKLPGVSEVRWGEPWVEGYAKVVRIAEWVGV